MFGHPTGGHLASIVPELSFRLPWAGSALAPAELPVLFQHHPGSCRPHLLAARGWARGWGAALTCTADSLCCRQVTDSQNKANKPCLELGSALSLQVFLWRSSAWFWQSGLGTQALKNYELLDFFSLLFSWLTATSALLTSSWMGDYSLYSWRKPRHSIVCSNLRCSSSKSLGWGPFAQSPWVSSFYTNFKLDLTHLTLAGIQGHGHKEGATLWTYTTLGPLRSTKMLRYLEQFATSILAPSQLRPPQRGRGLSHERDLHIQEPVLSPSECSHSCHGDQGPNRPFVVRFFT